MYNRLHGKVSVGVLFDPLNISFLVGNPYPDGFIFIFCQVCQLYKDALNISM